MTFESLIGLLPDDWELTTLGGICKRGGGDIQTGPFGSQLHASDYVPAGVPSIMPQNIGDNRIVVDGIARIALHDAERLIRYRVKVGDIVYSRRGDVERRALIRKEEDGWLCGTGCLRIRFGNGIVDPLFASYYLGHSNVREWVVRHAVGATMPNLNTSILSSLPFVVPPLSVQQSISQFLGAFDDKVELNNRIKITLEQIAHTFFKSWFVDFDPVKAKADGHAPESIDTETAALLPSAFEESKLGLIPRGWRVSTIGEEVEVLGGTTPSTKEPLYWEGGVHHWVTPRDLSKLSDKVLLDTDRKITDAGLQQISSGQLPVGAVLLSSRAPIGYLALAQIPVSINQGFIAMVCDKQLSPNFVLQWAEHSMDKIKARGSGTTFAEINKANFRPIPIVVPPPEVIRRFDHFVTPIYQQITEKVRENTTLNQLRDELLPKLISGKLRLADLEE